MYLTRSPVSSSSARTMRTHSPAQAAAVESMAAAVRGAGARRRRQRPVAVHRRAPHASGKACWLHSRLQAAMQGRQQPSHSTALPSSGRALTRGRDGRVHPQAARLEAHDRHADVGCDVAAAQALRLLKAPDAAAHNLLAQGGALEEGAQRERVAGHVEVLLVRLRLARRLLRGAVLGGRGRGGLAARAPRAGGRRLLRAHALRALLGRAGGARRRRRLLRAAPRRLLRAGDAAGGKRRASRRARRLHTRAVVLDARRRRRRRLAGGGAAAQATRLKTPMRLPTHSPRSHSQLGGAAAPGGQQRGGCCSAQRLPTQNAAHCGRTLMARLLAQCRTMRARQRRLQACAKRGRRDPRGGRLQAKQQARADRD